MNNRRAILFFIIGIVLLGSLPFATHHYGGHTA